MRNIHARGYFCGTGVSALRYPFLNLPRTEESRIVPLFRKTEHILVSVKTGLGCARARHHQPFKPEPPFKREDAAATAERYRKVPLVGGDLLQVHEYNVVDGCGTLENLSQILPIASMAAG